MATSQVKLGTGHVLKKRRAGAARSKRGAHHVLRRAKTDPAVMQDLRRMCADWLQVHLMSDHDVIQHLLHAISSGRLHLAEAGSDAPAAAAGGASDSTDPAIEALGLAETAKKAAYALKRKYPSIAFTSGKRSLSDQARAMASNVTKNRKWIVQTYADSTASRACQKWVDDHPEAKTQADLATGILEALRSLSGSAAGRISKHLTGEAFDVQPVDENAEAIKETIRKLPGVTKFLDKEGGLVRWHAQF